MIFHRAKFKTTSQDVVMQNSALTCVTTTKFLGVIIDHKFKWNDHITYIKSKISKSIGILYKIRRFLDMNTLIQMYHSFVFLYLIYCVEIWGNASAINLDPLKKIQKKIFTFFYVSSLELFCLFKFVVLLYIYNVILYYPLCSKVLYKIKIILGILYNVCIVVVNTIKYILR